MHTFSVHALPSSHWALMEHAVGAGVGAAVTPVGKLKFDMVWATFLLLGYVSPTPCRSAGSFAAQP